MPERVLAEGGPVGGQTDLNVDLENGKLPKFALWTWEDQSHRYELLESQRALGPNEARPVYRYVGPVDLSG